MRSKIYKLLLTLMAFAVFATGVASAQKKQAKPAAKPVKPVTAFSMSGITIINDEPVKVNVKDLNVKLKDLNVKLDAKELQKFNKELAISLKDLNKNLNISLANLDTKLANIADVDFDIDIDTDIDIDEDDIAISSTHSGNVQDDDLDERVKTYSKSYPADRNDELSIDNRYGKVTINTWNKNEFRIDVQVKVATSKKNQAQKMLDGVTISDGRDGQTVWFKTGLNSGSGDSWSIISGSSRVIRHTEINYTVYMPAKNSLKIANRYGSITLPDLYGKVSINSNYGKIYAKALRSASNEINCKYTDLQVDGLGNCNLNLSYGSVKLGKTKNLQANINYAPVNIDQLEVSGDLNVKYGGGVKIGDLGNDLKSLNINSAYAGVNVGLNGNNNFNFDVTVTYNRFNHDAAKVKVVDKIPDDNERGFSSTKSYKGYVGKNNTDAKVTIYSKYQGVSIQ